MVICSEAIFIGSDDAIRAELRYLFLFMFLKFISNAAI